MRAQFVSLLALLAWLVAVVCSGAPADDWSMFKRRYNKHYTSAAEEARRFANFAATLARIQQHNGNASRSFTMGLSHLADWHEHELDQLNGFRMGARSLEATRLLADQDGGHPLVRSLLKQRADQLPAEVDWRRVANRVSGVKNQGVCGSCWAFATTGLLEGQQVARKLVRRLTPLSEQELVDCSHQGGNHGCEGGIMHAALADIARLGGIASESSYPYRGQASGCSLNRSQTVMSAAGALLLPANDELALKKAVAHYGPVAVAMFSSRTFQHYQTGVFDDPARSCPPNELNHAVVVVGYGTDPRRGDYWILKNSWSTNWGDRGYVKMRRGVNLCGIASLATIAKF